MSDSIDRDLEELFASGADDEEAEEERLLRQPCPLVPVQGPALGEVLSLDVAGPQLELTRDDDDATLHLVATVTNHGPGTVELGEMTVVLRDPQGRLLDCATLSVDVSFRRAQEVLGDVDVSLEALAEFETIELWGAAKYNVTARVFDGVFDPWEAGPKARHRKRWPVESLPVEPRPGEPELRVDLAAFTGHSYSPFADFVFTLHDVSRAIESADAVLVLRDADAQIVAKEKVWLRDLHGAPSASKVNFDIERPQLRRARKVELVLKADIERTERLGVFKRADLPAEAAE